RRRPDRRRDARAHGRQRPGSNEEPRRIGVMVKVTLKGILAHKIRFLLTGVAVILGVAFIAGTLVLTATINKTFDGLFTNIYANTDAAVRQKAQFDLAFGAGRGRLDDSV